MSDPHDLRGLVQALTRPRRIAARATVQPSLLTELRAATSPNVGRGSGGGSAAHERIAINVGAADLLVSIEKRVRTWAIRSGYRPPAAGWPPVEQVLAHWHARTDGDPNLDPRHYAKILRGWVGGITDLMDPPYRFPLEYPCPQCGAEWTKGDIDNGTDPNRALNVIERIPADRSVIVCHACGHEWHGEAGAHELNALLPRRKTVTA